MELKIKTNEYTILSQVIECLKENSIYNNDIDKNDREKLYKDIMSELRRSLKENLFTKEELLQGIAKDLH